MTSVVVAVRVRTGVPPVPVTVRVYVPLGELPGTFTVIVDEVVAGFGLNEPIAPKGRPATVRMTGELKPFVRLIVTV